MTARSELPDYACAEFIPFDGQPGVCARCGAVLTGRARRWCSNKCLNEWRSQHDWGSARLAARRRDGHKCVREGCGSTVNLEVNHIEPRRGRGYGWGCHNHLANLETLCRPHHVEVTRQQASDQAREFRILERERHFAEAERAGVVPLPLEIAQ